VAVSQLKIPIEFANRPAPQPSKHTLPQPVIWLIVAAIAGAATASLHYASMMATARRAQWL